VVVDRLGYGASGRPDGNQVCYGSEGDYLHQVIGQLRHGTYDVAGVPAAPAFDKIALAGHSAGGFMVEVEAESYHDIDALILNSFANFVGPSVATFAAFGNATLTCQLNPPPDHYTFFGPTPQDFQAQHFYNADPAVVADVVARHAPDPCMDTGSALQSVVIDALSANSIKVPVLIVNGQNDALFPPPAGQLEQLLFSGNPDVKQVTLPATGHAVTLGRTAPQYRATVGAWLRGHGF
jgi:pimeloyl-ACP methyl ester carboxylesterase